MIVEHEKDTFFFEKENLHNYLSSLTVYSKYRNHPTLSSEDIRLHSFSLLSSLLRNKYTFTIDYKGQCQALVSIQHVKWDSSHFNMPMARIFIFSCENINPNALGDCIMYAVKKYSELHGCKHYSVDVDIDNYCVLNVLIGLGFEIMDFKKTFSSSFIEKIPSYERFLNRVRQYNSNDESRVLELIDNAGFETRYTRDRYLNSRLSSGVYTEWMLSLINMFPDHRNAFVYEVNGGVEACGAVGEVDLNDCNVNRCFAGNSIYASSRKGVGGYAPLLYQLSKDAISRYGLIESTISLNLTSALRVVEGLRPNKFTSVCSLRYFSL